MYTNILLLSCIITCLGILGMNGCGDNPSRIMFCILVKCIPTFYYYLALLHARVYLTWMGGEISRTKNRCYRPRMCSIWLNCGIWYHWCHRCKGNVRYTIITIFTHRLYYANSSRYMCFSIYASIYVSYLFKKTFQHLLNKCQDKYA